MKGLSRLPVTEEIAGSNPVEPATKKVHHLMNFFCGHFNLELDVDSRRIAIEKKSMYPLNSIRRSDYLHVTAFTSVIIFFVYYIAYAIITEKSIEKRQT